MHLSGKDGGHPRPRHKTQQKAVFALALAGSLILSAVYMYIAVRQSRTSLENETLELAHSIGAVLPVARLTRLSEVADNQEIPEYQSIKEQLNRLVAASDFINHARALGIRNDTPVVLVGADTGYDADPADTGVNLSFFRSHHSIMIAPASASSEVWVRVLEPVPDITEEKPVALLELCFSATMHRMKAARMLALPISIVAIFNLIVLSMLLLWLSHRRYKDKSRALETTESLYRSIFEQAPIGIALMDGKGTDSPIVFRSVNPKAESILGYDASKLACLSWQEITHPDDLPSELELFEPFMAGQIQGFTVEKRILRPDGSSLWIRANKVNLKSSPRFSSMYLSLIEDISARKDAQENLRESERSKNVILSHLPGMAYRCAVDGWQMEFVSLGCQALTGYPPESLLHNRDLSFDELIPPQYRIPRRQEWERILRFAGSFRAEYEIRSRSGEQKWVLELGQGVIENGVPTAFEGIILDITEQKKRDAQISYLSEHDLLTGLHNRNFLEKQKARLGLSEHLPLSVMICDINGLRLVNDAFGFGQGDRLIVEVAELLKGCSREGDILGRTDGGEFLLLMPNTSEEEARKRKKAIRDTLERRDGVIRRPLPGMSLSMGYGTKETLSQSVDDAIRTAEEFLERRKLLNRDSAHHAIVASIMASLYAKSQETEEHGKRLARLSGMIGERLGLDARSMDDLQLLSILHDIGKIGVDDSILNKPAPLSPREWEQMRQHPHIGYRIAMSSPQLESIARYILHHHEAWDGTGYPLGLKGTEIPLMSRIIAVVDAFDAMTERRVYRKSISYQDALKELQRCAGTQFDPEIAELLVALMGGSEN